MRTLILVSLLSATSIGVAMTDPLAHMDPRGVVSIIVDQAATVGVDYREAMRLAYAGNQRALADLFRVTLVSDGGGATLHSGYLKILLSRFGDGRYSTILSRQRAKVRKSVIDAIDFAFRDQQWATDFPLTYRIAPHDPYWPERANQAMRSTAGRR